jgi:hypothetical protein
VCPYFNPTSPADIEGYRDRGVDRLVVLCLAFDEDMVRASLEQLATDVLAPANA